MRFVWDDYNPDTMGFVENWLDEYAVKETGMDDGWCEDYKYWLNDGNTVIGENYWCKIISESGKPFAVIAIGCHDDIYNIMEILVNPEERSKGKGAKVLKDLLGNSEEIIGKKIEIAESVIFPSNRASKKAFEKAGFVFNYAHEDGDALYYIYK